ncbi:HD family phosphohydrolase [Salinibacillus xinjiangensis]|uniref:HDIG domain-containing protein n=1 Tax=Salinibacillus xinjiangensis TaxID=1229268 RepID=A0A6G1X6S6_9BACI|nr:HDIG domain-containing metalloprotein [Salinibacillus xinjiangensis]MRG86629.1 HDIG domain-containing protein [Salinibacillus xinjiangensis]
MRKPLWKNIKNKMEMKDSSVWMMICIILIGLFFFVMAAPNLQPQSYEIEEFTEAQETIYSPVTIEDQKETESKIQRAVQAVDEQYTISDQITQDRMEYINEIFDAAEKINQMEADGKGEKSETERLSEYESLLGNEITKNVNTETLATILSAEAEELLEAKQFLLEHTREIMTSGVKSSNLRQKEIEFNRNVVYSPFSDSLKDALSELGSFFIVENSFFDAEKTAEERRKAASNVDPVMIRAGETLVESGDMITSEIYEDLLLVGVLKNERNLLPYIGLGLLILILSGLLYLEWLNQRDWDKKTVFTIFIISIGAVSTMKIFSYFDTNELRLFLAVPAATGVMVIKWLINDRFAIILAIIYSVMAAILFNFHMPGFLNVEAGLYMLFSQLTGIYLFQNMRDRGEMVKVGLGILVVNVLTILFFTLISFTPIDWRELFTLIGFGFGGAFFTSVLTLGLMPFFETGLNILSESKLLSLANPNHPLLRKILVEAPGTYHHSVMVANLSEAACEAVGANGLLARVAAYYHDLGKTVNPRYFIENQMGEKNPHDLLQPEQSAKIIINHPYDGAYLLREHKMPKEITDIAEQHHGQSLLKFFYYKAKEADDEVKQSQYRYPGPKPQTKEAAIVFICDSVEAAVRSMNQPSVEKLEEVVKSIIHDKLIDGQLSECPLTFQNLNQIEIAVCELLKGIFHSRIKYPDQAVAAKEEN